MHLVLVNHIGGLSLTNNWVRFIDRPDVTISIYCGRNATAATRTTNLSYLYRMHNVLYFAVRLSGVKICHDFLTRDLYHI